MATIFDIKHFAVHDGDGIRTTVFFKGCPLRCVWCHNPEGLARKSELAYLAEKCVSCAACVAVCQSGVHKIEGTHTLFPSDCTLCGACADACKSDALTLYGREVTVEELLPELLEDRDFYLPRGGVTLSGGECLLEADFCRDLLRRLKEEGIHTAVDTSGAVAREAIEKVLPYTDLFLYDIKAYDEEVHRRCTGDSNRRILDNLLYLDSVGAEIEIRIPFVPDYNDTEMEAVAHFLSPLRHVRGVKVLPYHRLSDGKYASLGLPPTPKIRIPSAEEVQKARDTLSRMGLKVL